MNLQKFRLRDVFTPGGMPSVTYVKRDDLGLESSLIGALERGHSIITVSGPTKSGKTVLCRKVIPNTSSVWIEGGQIREPNDFWTKLADALAVASITTASKNSAAEDSTVISAGTNVGIPGLAGAKGDATTGRKKSRGSQMIRTYDSDLQRRTIRAALDSEKTIVIDDFHFIDTEVQRHIVNSLKAAIFDGLDVVVIAVPHRAFDPLSVQQEMQGRFSHVEVKNWSEGELKIIPEIGFPTLNVISDDSLIENICREASGNPLLVQDLCFRICQNAGIRETSTIAMQINGDHFSEICASVAESSGFPIFERLARGPQARKDRRMRPLRQGGEVDTYQAILLAVTMNGAKSTTPYDEIRSSMREILEEGGLPQKNEVTSACGHMSSIARNELENVEPIEWHNDALVISDPFLLFFMRWRADQIWIQLTKRART